MIAALAGRLVPTLIQGGFSGEFPHFRRRNGDTINTVSFQFDKYGGGFTLEAGRAEIEAFRDSAGTPLSFPDTTTFDLSAIRGQRARLRPVGDEWGFRFDECGENAQCYDEIAKTAERFLPVLEEWFQSGAQSAYLHVT